MSIFPKWAPSMGNSIEGDYLMIDGVEVHPDTGEVMNWVKDAENELGI